MPKKIDRMGKALGATKQMSVRKRASGPLELLQLGEEIGARLSSRGGRPSDPKWNVRRVIPLKQESWNYLRQHELPATRAQDFRAFVAAARADEGQTIALEKSVADAPAIPDSVKVEELVQAAEAAARSRNYPVAEQLLKRVIEKA